MSIFLLSGELAFRARDAKASDEPSFGSNAYIGILPGGGRPRIGDLAQWFIVATFRRPLFSDDCLQSPSIPSDTKTKQVKGERTKYRELFAKVVRIKIPFRN